MYHKRKEKSIVEFTLTKKRDRNKIIDIKVRRGPEICSDNFLVARKNKNELEEDSKKNMSRTVKSEKIHRRTKKQQRSDKKIYNRKDDTRRFRHSVEQFPKYVP